MQSHKRDLATYKQILYKDKNEVSFRWKKPLEYILDSTKTNKTSFGAPD